MLHLPHSSEIAAELEQAESQLGIMETFETRLRAMLTQLVKLQASQSGYQPDMLEAGMIDAFVDAKTEERISLEHRVEELRAALSFAEEREDRSSYHRSVA
jgi:hypothetical protein